MLKDLKKQIKILIIRLRCVLAYIKNFILYEQFIRQYGINRNLLLGDGFDRSGLLFRRDTYQVFNHYLDKKSKTGTFKINYLILDKTRPFSNSLIQLCNISLIGEKLGVDGVIFTDKFWFLKSNFRINNIHFFNGLPENLPDGYYLKGNFFYLETLKPVVGEEIPSKDFQLRKLRSGFILPEEATSRYDLAIHIRSRELFYPGGSHPLYGQPPLAYYLMILGTFKFSSIAIVYEDFANPVIDEVIKYASTVCDKIKLSNGSFKDDLNTLLSAKNLVVGIGTFMSGVALLSDHVVNVFTFNASFDDWGRMINRINVVDLKGEYIANILNGNWHNTPDQINMMLNYPQKDLQIEGQMNE